MPVSSNFNVGGIMGAIRKHARDATSCLDIAAGWGKYGVLLREFFDIKVNGRYDKERWKCRIDMVEIWPDYITPMHEFVYSNVYLDDIRAISADIHAYDIVLLLEVLEHMSHEDGVKVLIDLKGKCNKLMFMAFPNYFNGGEGKGWANPYEEHRCLWTQDDVEATLGMKVEKVGPTAFCANFVK
jgi:hypothetical protein